jgi:hypothetical protein
VHITGSVVILEATTANNVRCIMKNCSLSTCDTTYSQPVAETQLIHENNPTQVQVLNLKNNCNTCLYDRMDSDESKCKTNFITRKRVTFYSVRRAQDFSEFQGRGSVFRASCPVQFHRNYCAKLSMECKL